MSGSLFSSLGLHSSRELARLEHDDRLLVVYQTRSDEDPAGPRIIIANENDAAAQSVVLTSYELRWLVHYVFGDPHPIPRWCFWRDDLRTLWWRARRCVDLREEPR